MGQHEDERASERIFGGAPIDPPKSPASRKSAERQRRKDAGEVRVEVWLTKEAAENLETVIRFTGYRLTQSEAIAHALYVASRP